MAKGNLSAEQMLDMLISECQDANFKLNEFVLKKIAIKAMRQFAKQETNWWQKLCDKWEKAYLALQKETDI